MLKPVFTIALLFTALLGMNGQLKQHANTNFYIQPSLHYGFIMPHIRSIEYMLDSHIAGFDIKFGTKSTAKNQWNYLYRYPSRGIGYFVTSLGNKELLGYGHALYSYINIPYSRKESNIQFNYQIGFGGGYLTRRFDLEDNLYNVAIGSHVNIFINFATDMHVKLSPKLLWNLGLNFSHFSNGKLRSPNLGLNLVTINTGLKYYFKNYAPTVDKPEIKPYNKNEYLLFLAGGVKSHDDLLSPLYFISSFSAEYHRQVSAKRKLGGGLDVFYDASIRRSLFLEGKDPIKTLDLYRLGLHASHLVMFKKMTMLVQLGHYFYYKYFEISNIYSRIGIMYNINSKFIARLSLKSHMANADFIEWGIGYKIK